MIDVRIALNHFGIDSTCLTHAVQQVREFIEEGGESKRFARTNELLEKVLGVRLQPADVTGRSIGDDYDYTLTIAQAAVEAVIKQDGVIDDVDQVMAAAKVRADKFITNPAHTWMFSKPESVAVTGEQVQVSADVDVKVAVKSDGSIKKGGKEVLAIALYEKFVTKAEVPVDNQGFIAILMKELGMSKAGATTYNYNMKKKFGGQIAAKPKK